MGSKNNILLSVIILLLVGGGAFWLLNRPSVPGEKGCTLEALICPDGSAVGRTGPRCEFAPCPTAPDMSGWKTATSSGVKFKYPENFGTKYISPVDWPPQVQVVDGPFACTDTGEEGARAGKTETKIIMGHEYCVTSVTEGAAGTTYIQYAYARENDGKTLFLTFSLKEVQCGNYSEGDMKSCETERAKFNIDLIMDRVIESAIAS